MTDIFSKKKRSEIMSKVRNKDSKIEVEFRKKLWSMGLRYRKNSTKHFGKPDIVSVKNKLVIFVDSCFWHGCKKHGSMPKTRKKFWETKILRNKKRDAEVNEYYKKNGWKISRIWEHSMKSDIDKAVSLLSYDKVRGIDFYSPKFDANFSVDVLRTKTERLKR